jgi:hypothetical protein
VFIAVFVTSFSIPTISFAAFEHGSTPHVLTDPATQGDRGAQSYKITNLQRLSRDFKLVKTAFVRGETLDG